MIHANTIRNSSDEYMTDIHQRFIMAIDREIEFFKNNPNIRIKNNRRCMELGIKLVDDPILYKYINEGNHIDYSKIISEYERNGWYNVDIQYVYSFIKRDFKTYGFEAIYKYLFPEKILYISMYLDEDREHSAIGKGRLPIGSGNF